MPLHPPLHRRQRPGPREAGVAASAPIGTELFSSASSVLVAIRELRRRHGATLAAPSKPGRRSGQRRPRHNLRVLGVSAGTSPIEHKAGSEHDEDMDVVAEEIISTYMGQYASPGVLLAAAASIVVLLSGLGARIVELVQAARWAHQECNRETFSPDAAADRSPRSSRRTTANTSRGSRPLYGDPSDKMISGVCSVRAPTIRRRCVLNGSNGRGPASTPLHESNLLVTDLRQGFGHPHHRHQPSTRTPRVARS